MDPRPESPLQRRSSSYELPNFKETGSSVHLQADMSAPRITKPSEPWQTGFLARFPFWGFGSWCFAVISTIAGILVLVFSDGVPVESWDSRLQPTVWLALTSTLTGALLAHAFTEAAAISWWRKAANPTSLQELHNTYESSTNLFIAIWNLLRLRTKILGLASIVMTLSAIRGPLMQRASLTANVFRTAGGTINFPIAQELPEDYGAILTGRTNSVSLLTRNFSDIAEEYSNRREMLALGFVCDNCTTSVKAFGFKVNCSSSDRAFDLDLAGGNMTSAISGADMFQINATEYKEPETWSSEDGAFLRLSTLYKETNECKGRLSLQTCDLHAGVSNMSVYVRDGVISLQSTWHDDQFLETKYMTPLGMKDRNIIGGFATVLSSIYGSSAWMHFAGARSWNIVTQGLPATQYMTLNDTTVSCADSWSNPMDDLIEVARELGFRASLHYARSNASDVQTVPIRRGFTVLVYVTDYSKLAIAVVVSFVGIFAVLPVFWGWWELGRNVTMNPLEVASAFERMSGEGSIFRGTDPNASASGIIKNANSVGKIRYGALEGDDGTCRAINAIASPIFWSMNTFCFLDAAEFTAAVGNHLRPEYRELLQSVSIMHGYQNNVTGYFTHSAHRNARLPDFWEALKRCKNLRKLDMPVEYLKSPCSEYLASFTSEATHLSTLRLNYLIPFTRIYTASKRIPQTVHVRCSRLMHLQQQEWTAGTVSNLKRELDTNFYVHVNTAVKAQLLGVDVRDLHNYSARLPPDLHEDDNKRRLTLPTGEAISVEFYGLPISQKTRIKMLQQKMELDRQQKAATGSTAAQHQAELEQVRRKKQGRDFEARVETLNHEQELVDRRMRRLALLEQDRKSVIKKKKKIRKAVANRIKDQKAERKRKGQQGAMQA
ncbi:hypothetical protein HJFPF1_12365 [Paramyrothecium foliicola]|nr:hypothetical protein HJFPF1_12365 [Paramyrothecium foliicola]